MTIELDRPFWFTVKASPTMTAPMGQPDYLLAICSEKRARLKPVIRNPYPPIIEKTVKIYLNLPSKNRWFLPPGNSNEL
jgi:hypothetical protein